MLARLKAKAHNFWQAYEYYLATWAVHLHAATCLGTLPLTLNHLLMQVYSFTMKLSLFVGKSTQVIQYLESTGAADTVAIHPNSIPSCGADCLTPFRASTIKDKIITCIGTSSRTIFPAPNMHSKKSYNNIHNLGLVKIMCADIPAPTIYQLVFTFVASIGDVSALYLCNGSWEKYTTHFCEDVHAQCPCRVPCS